MEIVTTMCKLFLCMGIGFYLYKKKIFTLETNAKVSTLLVQFGVPCIVLNSVASVPHDDPQLVLKIFFAGIIAYGIFVLIGYVFTGILRVPKYLKGTYICMLVFANSAFMGYPVGQAMFGDIAIFYITIFNMPFNVLFFSLGMHYFRKDNALEAETGKRERPKPTLREIFNGGLLSSIAAMIIYFADIPMPQLFYSCVGFVGGIVTPLSMIIIGSSLGALSLREILKEKGVWPMLPMRLAIIPLIVWLFMHLFTDDPAIIAMCTVSAGMPVASITVMGSSGQPRQNQTAAVGVAVSTICSMISIPIMIVLLNQTL